MSQLSYADLLDAIGLSNWQFVLLVVLGLMGYAAISMCWQIGAVRNKDVPVRKVRLPTFHAVIISYEGSYDDIGTIFSQCQ